MDFGFSTTGASLSQSNQPNGSQYGNAQNDLTGQPEQPPIEIFRVIEDPECKAKEHYETSKEKYVTDFHVEMLHTAYIPNVNGNWDHKSKWITALFSFDSLRGNIIYSLCFVLCLYWWITVEPVAKSVPVPKPLSEKPKKKRITRKTGTGPVASDAGASDVDDYDSDLSDDEIIAELNAGLYERVVPLCNYRIKDPLPKSLKLGDVHFSDDEMDLNTFLCSIGMNPQKSREEESNNDEQMECEPIDEGKCKQLDFAGHEFFNWVNFRLSFHEQMVIRSASKAGVLTTLQGI